MPYHYSEEELEILQECEKETRQDDKVAQRFQYIYFVSNSKGRNRPRKEGAEIELVEDRYTGRCITWRLCPFDDWGTETIPQTPELKWRGSSQSLQEKIRRLGK